MPPIFIILYFILFGLRALPDSPTIRRHHLSARRNPRKGRCQKSAQSKCLRSYRRRSSEFTSTSKFDPWGSNQIVRFLKDLDFGVVFYFYNSRDFASGLLGHMERHHATRRSAQKHSEECYFLRELPTTLITLEELSPGQTTW
ncbi:hypothetical protein GGS26DRAFT_95458 [Hypomontagnella submonticulosa]|nr:hypothetical protein GGS26DRAFT_95458 [Hypomontagnella submonticulosa]